MGEDLLSRAMRRVNPGQEISRISRKYPAPGNDKSLDCNRFPGFPGFPGSEVEVGNSGCSSPGGRAWAGGSAGARGHVAPGNPGNPGNANSHRGIVSLSISQKERETGKSGKSRLPALAALALHPDDATAFFDERAGIYEFDGEVPRLEAEAAALRDVEQALADGRIPDRRPRF